MTTIDYRQLALDLIKGIVGKENIIAIPRTFITLMRGDYVAAAMLNQILYWQARTSDPDGWFYKTAADWQDELSITEYQISRAIHGDKRNKNKTITLADLGIETKVQVVKGTMTRATFYRVDWGVFMDKLAHHLTEKPNPTLSGLVGKANQTTLGLRTQQCKGHSETTAHTTGESAETALPPLKPTPAEVDTAIYGTPDDDVTNPDNARRILALPPHLKNMTLDNMVSHPLIDAYAETLGAPYIATRQDKTNALRATIAGYTPDDMRATVNAKRKPGQDYALSWAISDLASVKAKQVAKPQTIGVMLDDLDENDPDYWRKVGERLNNTQGRSA